MPPPHTLHLVDIQSHYAAALQRAFEQFANVIVTCADILAVAENAIVSPANSHGFMDGGIDQIYIDFFGLQLERRVQTAIALRPEGYLPVGASLTVTTGHARIPYLVVAPTMVTPEMTNADASYRAMRAVLREMSRIPDMLHTVYCPGLATGAGAVPPKEAAEAMAEAYGDWVRAAG